MLYKVTVVEPVCAIISANSEKEAIEKGRRAFENMEIPWYCAGPIIDIKAEERKRDTDAR